MQVSVVNDLQYQKNINMVKYCVSSHVPSSIVCFRGKNLLNFQKTLPDRILRRKILTKPKGLSGFEQRCINKFLSFLNHIGNAIDKRKLILERLLMYDRYKKQGVSGSDIEKFGKEDLFILGMASELNKENERNRLTMLGYPANIGTDSLIVKKLRDVEALQPLMNNCGDTNCRGNYRLDSKNLERMLIQKVSEHVGWHDAWGYVTSGGSESNRWGIENGIKNFPNGRVYYSHAVHYSVPKVLTLSSTGGENVELIKSQAVKTALNSEKIDVEDLIFNIKKNWNENKEPAIILLTWGTTKTGAVDDVKTISKHLNEEGIPHYIHLDAALYGGIPKNQTHAPILPNLDECGINSVCISLHKYLGNTSVNSIILTKEKPTAQKVDYIGQIDSTTAGSRDFNPLSSYQRVVEIFERQNENEYFKNIEFLEQELKKYNIPFTREENSNIFVFDKPSDLILQKYQLSDFCVLDVNGKSTGKEKAHAIIFPYHSQKLLNEFVQDLANDLR